MRGRGLWPALNGRDLPGSAARRRIVLAAAVTGLALVGLVFWIARSALDQSFASIESEQARQSIERVRNSFDADLLQLAVTTQDYAEWNELYHWALKNGGNGYEDLWARRQLNNVHVSFVWATDRNGHDLAAFGEDPANAAGLRTMDPSTLAALKSVVATGADLRRPRLVRLPGGPAAVAAFPILEHSGAGDSPGRLLYGRYIGEPMRARLETLSQSTVRLQLLDGLGHSHDALTPQLSRWLARGSPHGGAASDLLLRSEDSGTFDSYLLLRDFESRPLLVLSTTVSRAALQLGRRAITWVMATLLLGFALLLAAVVSLLDREWQARAQVQRQWFDHQRRIARLARRDALTGLANRLHLERLMPRLIARAQRRGGRLALLYLDLDHFKDINDSLGHGTGDRLLTAIAGRLRRAVAARDLVVRMGGDEFVVAATGLADAEAAARIAERVRRELAAPIEVEGATLAVSPSIGISLFPEHGTDPEQLLKYADIAMYHAKECGRGTHQLYTPDMHERLRERIELEQALRLALERRELSVEYQPCYELGSLRPVGLEALVRWYLPDGSNISPARFIPVAEQGTLIGPIGEFVIERVCAQLAAWQRERLPLVPVSVNLSVRQLENTELPQTVARVASTHGVDPRLLHFEVTESAAMPNLPRYLDILQGLRDLGARILIDDFGTGYSSLSYLKHLPIDVLKIDRSFVRDMAEDANDAAIVRAIVGVAHSLGLLLVAEGIESPEQLACLRELGCERGQGFLLSPPLKPEDCRAVLTQLRQLRLVGEPAPLRALKPAG